MDRRRSLTMLAGLALAWKSMPLIADAAPAKGPVIVAAGRRVDAPDAQSARFPPGNVDVVRKRIRQVFSGKNRLPWCARELAGRTCWRFKSPARGT